MDLKECVKDFYGKHLKSAEDLQADVCKTRACNMAPNVREALKFCHEEVIQRYFGCGSVFPECLEECRVLDLGCGSGRDCFILSKLVGEKGFVTGVDMTPEQVDIANKYKDFHAKAFGHNKPNTEFIMGDIENLKEAGVTSNSYDVVVSNCVVNLTSDKKSVLEEAWRVLKEGGEVYFSDMYADRAVSDEARKNKALWGEGFAGALVWRDLVKLCKDIGFSGPYLVASNKIICQSAELRKILGDEAQFVSATYRLIKSPRQYNSDVALQATYKGGEESAVNNTRPRERVRF
ncbi:arsenite methyltransferase isoform X2 [Nematostella vectensis]|uniref:arsenite methyltransferase isoform X2 n=1 Tax=Nematostella vectensis TaxID=45351 RepID=UPI0013903F93|nr:arsenite methyltransferase isoform X2 [Nematostella vectensis]